MSRLTDKNIDLSQISERSASHTDRSSKKENTINVTQIQKMDNYLSSWLQNADLFTFLENLVIDIPDVFEFVTKPSIYVIDIDLISSLKETENIVTLSNVFAHSSTNQSSVINNPNMIKKKHRWKSIVVKEREWILITENISLITPLPESTLYMDTKQLSEGKEFIYNKQQEYILLPLPTADGRILGMLQLYRNPQYQINGRLKLPSSTPVLVKAELNVFQIFLDMIGSHLDTI